MKTILALLLIPAVALAGEMDELIELQREQLQVQKQILDNQESQRLQNSWMEPSKNTDEYAESLQRQNEAQNNAQAIIQNYEYQRRKEQERVEAGY